MKTYLFRHFDGLERKEAIGTIETRIKMKKFEADKAKWRKLRGGGGKEKGKKKHKHEVQAEREDGLESKWDRGGVYFSSGVI